VNLLVALPVLPVAVALWLAFSARAAQLGAGWVVALVALFPMAVAVMVSPVHIPLPGVLVLGTTSLVLDAATQAALLLFGGLWLAAGLLLTRTREAGPSAIALLLGLMGASLLAIADGGPLVYAGMLATGYGLVAIIATEPGEDWRRAGRTLVILLVLSDLLVFELLLSLSAEPGVAPGFGLLLMGLAALALRGAIPPGHVWLPVAMGSVSTPSAVLLAAVPTGAALVGGLKLLPDGAPEVALLCLLLGLAGAAWVLLVGLLQTDPRSTLGYAVAATAALLLVAFPAGPGPEGQLPWLGLALLASCAVLPLVALLHTGWGRDLAIASMLLIHGLAGGHAAVHAGTALPLLPAFFAPLVAVAATLVLTVAARRTPAVTVDDGSVEPTRLAYTPVTLAAVGLGFAWTTSSPGFASLWPAPVGITLGLLAYRCLPARTRPAVAPGDLLGPVERFVSLLLRVVRVLSLRYLPRLRDRVEAVLLGLWNGEAWSRRMHKLDIRLRSWPATSLMMLVVALGAAYLMAR
jgi:hypothetical protein